MPQSRPPYAPEFRQQMIELVRAGRTPAAKGEGLSCVVLASSSGDVKGFVLSLLPELGTMGSKWGGAGVTRSSTS